MARAHRILTRAAAATFVVASVGLLAVENYSAAALFGGLAVWNMVLGGWK